MGFSKLEALQVLFNNALWIMPLPQKTTCIYNASDCQDLIYWKGLFGILVNPPPSWVQINRGQQIHTGTMVDAIMMHHQFCKEGSCWLKLGFTYNRLVTIHSIMDNHGQGNKNNMFTFTSIHKHTILFLDLPSFSNTNLLSV